MGWGGLGAPVSVSPPLYLDAFETGRESMWPAESTLGEEWLHVLRAVVSLVSPPLQDG